MYFQAVGNAPGLGINVEHFVRVDTKLDKTTSDFRDDSLDVDKGVIMVVAELEIFPFFLLNDLLAINCLCNFLLYLVNFDDVSPTKSVSRAVRTSRVLQKVVYGIDALRWLGHEFVL